MFVSSCLLYLGCQAAVKQLELALGSRSSSPWNPTRSAFWCWWTTPLRSLPSSLRRAHSGRWGRCHLPASTFGTCKHAIQPVISQPLSLPDTKIQQNPFTLCLLFLSSFACKPHRHPASSPKLGERNSHTYMQQKPLHFYPCHPPQKGLGWETCISPFPAEEIRRVY